jgi:hypothetical protein
MARSACCWSGAPEPACGLRSPSRASAGGLGVWRFLVVHRNPFSVVHVAIDVVVVALYGYLVCRGHVARRDSLTSR